MHPDPVLNQGSAGDQSPEVNAQHPWLGLLPYKEEHRDFFFGRDREVEDILGRIRDNSLTILYGQSGLGKSSLLAAGVVPRLRELGYDPQVVRLGFGERLTLREQMLAMLPKRTPFVKSQLDPKWLPRDHSLWELFHRKTTAPADHSTPVLIFDQFEEIFTLGAQPQFERAVADWWEEISDLLQNRPPKALAEQIAQDTALAEQYHFGDAPVRIVLTLREDYLAHLERWKARLPLLMQNRMALTLLTGPQARQAVLGPAQLGDDTLVSREVAENIVRTVARVSVDTPLEQIKAVPPLLSLLCEQLNAARLSASAPQITAESVRDQADDILQRFYEDSFLFFPEEHRARIRALIEDPPMITEGGFRNSLVRDDAQAQLTRAGVTDACAVFDTLIQRRLITAEEQDRVQRLEVTHDVLVPMLLRSRKERQDREAKEKAELAAAAAKAEQERLARERRRLRYIVVAMTALALIAGGLAAFGWWQSEKAKEANEKNLSTLHEASMADYAMAVRRIEKDGKWSEGVTHLARSLKWEPENPLSAARLYSTLALYAAEKQSWPREILRHEDYVESAQFSPDGTRIVTASDDNTARVWDAATGKALGEPLRHEDYVRSAQFSPDSTRIVTASRDKTARVWDAATGKALGEPLRHEGDVRSAQFSPDGTRIVTASRDKTAQVWDVATGKALGEPLRHEGDVWSAQFSPDGTRIVTASSDKTARVWDAPKPTALVPVPDWLLQRARAVAGLEFDLEGEMKTIPGDQRLTTLTTPPPEDGPWTKLARWLALPANERTLTPDSTVTFRQIAERERDAGTAEGLRSALHYDPTVPLAHLLLAEFEQNPQTAALLRDFGLRRLPDDADLWARASTSLVAQNQSQIALDAARKAMALDASQISSRRALANALPLNGQGTEALAIWGKVLADPRATFDDFCYAGQLAAELNLGDKTRAIFHEGETRFPTIPKVLRFKGMALLLLHAPAEALEALEAYESKLAADDGSKPPQDAVATLSVSRWLTGDKDGAVKDYQRLIGMVSAYADATAVKESNWQDAIKQPMLELLAETLKRHPEPGPNAENISK